MNNDTPQFLGILPDTRPEEKKQKDISQVEFVASASAVKWVEKTKWRKFLDQNQNGSGSCVKQTVRKLAQINYFLKEGTIVEFSAGFYQLRSNKPAPGMMGVEAFDIWMNEGIPLECLVESDHKTDEEMDAFKIEQYKKDVAKVFRIGGHVGLPITDFERIASTIQTTGKGVMVWFYFNIPEWAVKFPKVLNPNLVLYGGKDERHSVAAVDFGLINGKKYIKIEDSAQFGGLTERWISEEFFNARNFFARYPMNFVFHDPLMPAPVVPKYTFTKPLEFIPLDAQGNISDLTKNELQKQDVKALQNILKFEGMFPLNTTSTGYYGAQTAKSLYLWQVKHAVAPLAELNEIKPRGGRVGSKTIIKLNHLYGN